MTPEPVSSINPYVGPRTFSREQGDLFFGREQEARDLLGRVISERLLLFYAQSGAGKSSLINARLIPGLEDEGFTVLPVGRVSGELPPGVGQVENIYLFNLMASLDQSGGDPQRFARLSLSDFLARLATEDGEHWEYDPSPVGAGLAPALDAPALDAPAPVATASPTPSQHFVLIVDQLEEIVTTHAERWQEREGFFRQLDQAMAGDRNLWVVLTLREDYVAALDPYASLVADRLRARFYMERMGVPAALEAVKRPAASYGRPFTAGVAEKLVDDLRQVRVAGQEVTALGPAVEPVQLQVVCYQLWERLQRGTEGAGGTQITEADLAAAGDVNQALEQFYSDTLANVLAEPAVRAAGVTERALREWFDKELITETGIRNTVFRNEAAGKTGTMTNVAVDALSKRFLVRTELRSGGAWVELVHDRFVEPIRANNAAWFPLHLSTLQRQAALWDEESRPSGLLLQSQALAEAETWAAAHDDELEPHERDFLDSCRQARDAAERERRQSRRIRVLGAVATGVALVALALGAFAMNSAGRAEKAETAANDAKTTAVAEADRASSAEATAVAERNLAENRTTIAEALLGVQSNFLAQAESRRLTESMLDQQRQRLEQGREVLASDEAPKAILPDLTGVGYADARQLLDAACQPAPCFTLQEAQWKTDDNVPAGSVLRTDPQAGAELPWGAALTITVSQGAPLVIEEPVRMEFIPIPAGDFSMGSDGSVDKLADPNEFKQHTVSLSEYYIGRYEVTNAQFEACVKAEKCDATIISRRNGEILSSEVPSGKEDHPAVIDTWNDAVAFTQWLSEESGMAFRLCSEAEWEKACRGPSGIIYPWGDKFDETKANTREGGPRDSTPVGGYSSVGGNSPYGVSDMAGNLWEWTSSTLRDYPYDPNDGTEDMTTDYHRVLRGGSYRLYEGYARCASRVSPQTDPNAFNLGLRVCVSPGLSAPGQ